MGQVKIAVQLIGNGPGADADASPAEQSANAALLTWFEEVDELQKAENPGYVKGTVEINDDGLGCVFTVSEAKYAASFFNTIEAQASS